MTTYHYSNTSVQTVLSVPAGAGDGTVTIGDATGLPASFPYSVILDYGASTVEVVTVTSASGTTLTVTRGQDGTSAQSHNLNAVVVHGVVARDLQAAQDHIAASTNVHGIGAANVVGDSTTQTLTNKSISGSTNTLSNIGDSSITALSASKLTGSYNGGGNFVSAADATVTLTATGTTTATGDLFQAFKGAVKQFFVTAAGAISAAAGITAGTSVTAGTTISAGTSVTGATTVTGQGSGDVVALLADVPNANLSDLLQLKRNSTVKAKVDKDGNATTANVTAVNVTASGTLGVTGTTTLGTASVTTANIATANISNTLAVGSSAFTVDGMSHPRGLLATGARTSGNIVGLASETTIADLGSVTFKANRAYRLEYVGKATLSSGAGSVTYSMKSGPGGTTYADFSFGQNLNAGFDFMQVGSGFVRNNTGSDVTHTIRFIGLGNGNVTLYGSSSAPFVFKIWDIGAAADHPEAIQI